MEARATDHHDRVASRIDHRHQLNGRSNYQTGRIYSIWSIPCRRCHLIHVLRQLTFELVPEAVRPWILDSSDPSIPQFPVSLSTDPWSDYFWGVQGQQFFVLFRTNVGTHRTAYASRCFVAYCIS